MNRVIRRERTLGATRSTRAAPPAAPRRRPSVAFETLLVAAWAVVATAGVAGQDERLPPDAIEPPAWPRSTRIWPAPDPFTLNSYDARQAAALIRRARLLVVPESDTSRRILPVRSVSIVSAGRDERYPPTHRDRWDIELNGEPLDWRSTYVENGGRLVNLQLLFTYRNQRPVPDEPFRLE